MNIMFTISVSHLLAYHLDARDVLDGRVVLQC